MNMKNLINKMISIIENFYTKMGEKRFCRYALVFFFVIAITPIFLKGLPAGHDLYFHLSRINGIKDGLASGAFPVLVYPSYLSGYGYGNGIFYPDFFLYIPAILHYLGLSTILSYKIFLILITAGILGSMYFCMKKITKSDFTATIVSCLYLMSSYRITDMWIRAALGETLTFVFLPFVILGLYKLLYENSYEWKYFTIGLVGIVLSHLLSGMLCVLVVFIFGICNIKKLVKEPIRIKHCLCAGIFAILITLFFTAPLLEAMQSDQFIYETYNNGQMVVERSVNPLFTILEVPLGIEPWIPAGIGVIFLYFLWKFYKVKITEETEKSFKNMCLIVGCIFLFMSTSLFPWQWVGKILGMLQFPWRFYILITILFLFGVAFYIKKDITTKHKKATFVLVTSIFMCFTFMISTAYSIHIGMMDDNDVKGTIIWGEYLPTDVNKDLYEERGPIVTSNHDVHTQAIKHGTFMEVEYVNNKEKDGYLELPLLYYHGYIAKEGNHELKVSKGENGVLRVHLEKESGTIHVSYSITPIRKYAGMVSAISLVSYIATQVYKKKKEENA